MATYYPRENVKACDLRIGDVLECHGGRQPWHTAIVKQVTDTDVVLFRPYGTTAGFAYSGGVICYIGLEVFNIPRNDVEFYVHQREELR